MQFTTSALLTVALAFSASAAPLADSPPTIEERQAQQLWSVSCNTNTQSKGFDRAFLVDTARYYCTKHFGENIQDDYAGAIDSWDIGGGYSVRLGPQGKKGCNWNIDDQCLKMQLMPVDKCNTEGENNKKGGSYDDQCATWTMQFIKN